MVEHPAATIEQATAALKDVKKLTTNGYKGNKPLYYVADEFSYMAERTWSQLESRFTGFRLWGKMREICIDFRDAAREANVGVIVNTWVAGPVTKSSGKFVRGGPQLPSDMPEKFPAIADGLILAEYDIARSPWPWRYRTTGDANWGMKWRDARVPSHAPMNLGEMLRFSGYKAPRPAVMAWAEETVETIAQHLLGVPLQQHAAICEDAYQLLRKQYDPRHAKWAVIDARDRALLHSAQARQWATFAPPTASLATL
jgi:hypothetical protein